MKANPLVMAVALLAILGGAVWYTRENPPENEDEAPKILDLEEDDIRAVTLRREGEDPIAVRRGEDGEWEFGGGLEVAADDSSVGLMIGSLASLNADRVVAENVLEWEPYDLEEPELRVSYELAEGGGELQFGRETPTGSGIFARLKDDPRLFTVYSYNKTSFEKSVFDLRDKRMLRVDQDSITEVTVEAGQGKLAFAQSDGDWRITGPRELRADDFTVGDLVRAVRTAEMTTVLEEGEATGKYSFRRPLATVAVTDAEGSHELAIAKDGDTYYARSSAHAGVYEVSSTLAESLDKPVEEFRNKKLFDFGYADPERVEVRAGERHATVARADEQWILESGEGRELEGEKVQTLLDRLRNLTATAFPSDRAADQARYGLDAAAIKAIVTPAADEGPPETVLISATGEAAVYAAREGEPTTYQIEQLAARDIERALEEVLREPSDEEEAADAESGSEGEGADSED